MGTVENPDYPGEIIEVIPVREQETFFDDLVA